MDDEPVPPLAIASNPVAFATGMLVQLLRLPEVGVPSSGVTSVGEVLSTVEPVPVEVPTPVPPLATGRMPVTLVVRLQ